jgi:hypothetical protein
LQQVETPSLESLSSVATYLEKNLSSGNLANAYAYAYTYAHAYAYAYAYADVHAYAYAKKHKLQTDPT